MTTNLVNIHPADELAALREEIKQMQDREGELRTALLLADDAGREGEQYRAFVQTSNRETVDKAALIAELGTAAKRFFKTAIVKSVKLAPKE